MSSIVITIGFVLCGLALLLLTVDGRRSTSGLTSFSRLLDEIMASRATRITLVLFWAWLGWHFLVFEAP